MYRFLSLLLTAFMLLIGANQVQASCGCDKPPPAPAAAIPHVGFQNSVVHITDGQFTVGGVWNVTLTVAGSNFTSSVQVQSLKDITDSTGQTWTPILPVVIPNTLGKFGPAQIKATCAGKTAVVIPSSAFTVIGAPITLGEATGVQTYNN